MTKMQLIKKFRLMAYLVCTGQGERVNVLLENMSREDLWYLRERTEELYSACAYAFEQKED